MNTEILKPTSSQAQGRIQTSRPRLSSTTHPLFLLSSLTLPYLTILLTSLRILLVSTMLLAPAPALGPCHNSFRSLRYPEFRN